MRAIPRGCRAEFATVVTAAMTVDFEELGRVHPVYATYWLAKHMELAGRKVLLPFLEPAEEGIGFSVHVEHLSPALPGMEVRVEAEHQKTEGNRVFCTCLAHNELGDLIGRGQTVQVVLPRQKLDHLLARLETRWNQARR